jgi:hypothetical protein
MKRCSWFPWGIWDDLWGVTWEVDVVEIVTRAQLWDELVQMTGSAFGRMMERRYIS